MTNYYVNAGATDDNEDGLTPSTPKKLITTVMDFNIQPGDIIWLMDGTNYDDASQFGSWTLDFGYPVTRRTKTYDFRAYDGGSPVLKFNYVYGLNGGNHQADITFTSCDIENVLSPQTAMWYAGYGSNCTWTFNDCTLRQSVSYYLALVTGNVTTNATFNTCVFNIAASGNNSMYFGRINTLNIHNCVFTHDPDGQIILFQDNTIGDVVVVNNTFTSNGCCIMYDNDCVCGNLTVTGNVFTECQRAIYVRDAPIDVLNFSNNDVTSTIAGTTVWLGLDEAESDVAGINWMNGWIFKNNTIRNTNASAGGHAALIGRRIGDSISGGNGVGAEVAYNILTVARNLDFGLVVKGCQNNVHNNVIRAGNALYVSGGCDNNLHHNSVYGIGGIACRVALNDANEGGDDDFPSGNVIKHNICDASGGSTVAIGTGSVSISDDYDTIVDYNCYVAGSSGIGYLDQTSLGTLGELQSKWDEFGIATNDHNSFVADPLFFDSAAATINLRLRSGSPCVDAGDPAYTPGSGETDADGNLRVQGFAVDIGAYENTPAIRTIIPTIIMTARWPFATTSGVPQDELSRFTGNATNLSFTSSSSRHTHTDWQIKRAYKQNASIKIRTTNAGVVGSTIASVILAKRNGISIELDRSVDYYVRVRENNETWSSWSFIDMSGEKRTIVGKYRADTTITKTPRGATVSNSNPRWSEKRSKRGVIINPIVYARQKSRRDPNS